MSPSRASTWWSGSCAWQPARHCLRWSCLSRHAAAAAHLQLKMLTMSGTLVVIFQLVIDAVLQILTRQYNGRLALREIALHDAACGGSGTRIVQLDARCWFCRQGHSFEARLYAERPDHDFVPDSGTIRRWHIPSRAAAFGFSGDGIRVDSGVQQGDEVKCNA